METVPLTPKQAADRIRYWARLNFSPEQMSYHQFIALANELDPTEGADTDPAVSGVLNEELKP